MPLTRKGSQEGGPTLPPPRFTPILLAAALTACGSDSPTTTSDNVGGRPVTGSLAATLTGAAAVPGPGDPDGRGTARITLDGQAGEICFELTVVDIEPAFAAHIHEGASDVEGPVAVSLAPPSDGFATGCVTGVNAELISAIDQNPAGYYVNVHNTPYPAGAVRGQLMR